MNENFIKGLLGVHDEFSKKMTPTPSFVRITTITALTKMHIEDTEMLDIEKIPRGFYCYDNSLVSLRGCPTSVGEDFYCSNNAKKFSKEEVKSICEVKCKITV